jgi:isopenicillin N synthase-like dioxygenase
MPQRIHVPLIDIEPLVTRGPRMGVVAAEIGRACREIGFFYVSGHGVSAPLEEQLETVSHRFFALPDADKRIIDMALGGPAWRGYFPAGRELTSGRPDSKEGLYFGAEQAWSSRPLCGPNLFPPMLPELRRVVLDYIAAMTRLGHQLMAGLSLSLGLPERYFHDRYTADPLVLFRVFHYPPPQSVALPADSWGVGEHTDYGLLTILKQDSMGGLEIKTRAGWIAAPPIPGTFVCNLGDMLDRMTGGRYRSTPHRVRVPASRGRLSFPFFFDPNLDARVAALPGLSPLSDDRYERWDQQSVHSFEGTYGEYLIEKVSRVFPDLFGRVLEPLAAAQG